MIVLVLGGAKSGKTKYAIQYAEELFLSNFYYIATAIPFDKEMEEKIKRHQEERGDKWKLIEEPFNLHEILKNVEDNSVILIDCLTIWLTNIIHEEKNVDEYTEKFLQVLKRYQKHPDIYIICVANEVGLGIVPDFPLGRKFRDLAGVLNQKVAEIADEVYFIIAGCPVILKS